MSCVCILTPEIKAKWPFFTEAAVKAAASLGYKVVFDEKSGFKILTKNQVTLEIEQSEIVTTQLGRDQKISVTRDGVTVTFARDARGRASLCVDGKIGHSEAYLRAIGEELSQRVVQTYIYQRIMEEMSARQFNIVEEERTSDNSIRLKVRRWDN
jgi:hypothetical protein